MQSLLGSLLLLPAMGVRTELSSPAEGRVREPFPDARLGSRHLLTAGSSSPDFP